MKRLSGNQLRHEFLDFFKQRGHAIISSSPLVPHDDPTLLFTNAGMVQFKEVFLGLDKRPYTRATTAQKCVRAGGKHNDLDTVGRTPRHHTFFEMMGNFSFGDYFKRDAITFAWDFLTGVLELPKERLWATVYQDDDEAYNLWLELTEIPEERIVRLGEKDNFWSMGDTGPCGPCSEVLIDRGEHYKCEDEKCGIGECDCDRWLELWNLVFMQFDRDSSGEMNPLPRPSIDTGMGLERVASILQEVGSNYETDLLQPLLKAVEEISGHHYHTDVNGFPFRVLADHARSCTFLISDGVLPSNEGRGYVLRRILRRAVRFGKSLDVHQSFLYRLVPVVVKLMGEAYPELVDKKDYIQRVVKQEEERFQETLNDGMRVAEEIVANVKNENRTEINGQEAFVLYDTYGFPLDLTEDLAEEHGLTVDSSGFENAMEMQRERARAAREDVKAWSFSASFAEALNDMGPTTFTGYENLSANAEVLALVKDENRVESASAGEEVAAVFSTTPCYPEGGGQVGDRGRITASGLEAAVEDTQRTPDGKIIHQLKILSGRLVVGDTISVEVNRQLRKASARNHSATHMLHQALREVLGEHVNQSGSLVTPERLRFDFSHFEALTASELQEIEAIVNEKILAGFQVETLETTFEAAEEMGATALFGEKYGAKVRVVRIGDYSIELCGGTHLTNTGEVGLFRIISEGGVGAGIRRIEAVTGEAAYKLIKKEESLLREAAGQLKVPVEQLPHRISTLSKELKSKEKELERLQSRMARYQTDEMLNDLQEVSGIQVLAAEVQTDMEGMRSMIDVLRNKLDSGVIVLGSRAKGKAAFVAAITKDLQAEGLHAGKLIGEIAKVAGGGGGGRSDMAQAGGKDPQKVAEALQLVPKVIQAQL